MSDSLLNQCISLVHSLIEENWEHLSALDQAIGDGDHGTNVKRGIDALHADLDRLATKPFGEGLGAAGMTLVMKIGGASGPLFWSLLKGMGEASANEPRTQEDVAKMLRAGTEAVKATGKSDTGMKTMIDVLEPVTLALETRAGITSDEISEVARKAAEDTKALVATKGRAAFLGERSVGHIDPGGQTVALVVESICNEMEKLK